MRRAKCFRGMTVVLATAMFFGMVAWLWGEEASDAKYLRAAREFLASPDGGGEQNALSDYARAYDRFDAKAYEGKSRAFNEMLKRAWTDADGREVRTLENVQPVLNEIWRGNEKPMMKHLPWTGPDTPMPDFFKCLVLGKLLILDANYCDYLGKPDFALAWYKHALIYSQRLCDEQSIFMGALVSMDLEKTCFENLQRFLLQRPMTAAQYQQILADLQRIEQNEIPLWRLAAGDMRCARDLIVHADGQLRDAKNQQQKQQLQYISNNKEQILRQYDEVSSAALSLLRSSFATMARSDRDALDSQIDPALEALTIAKPVHFYMAARVRHCHAGALAGMTQVIAGVLLYRAQKGNYPASLTELSAVMPRLPLDPFLEKNFKYRNAGTYRLLYSVGPDLIDNQGMDFYDPENGAMSSGDIVVRF